MDKNINSGPSDSELEALGHVEMVNQLDSYLDDSLHQPNKTDSVERKEGIKMQAQIVRKELDNMDEKNRERAKLILIKAENFK